MKCALCSCYNSMVEADKHPSDTSITVATRKLKAINEREPAAIASFCEEHRNPLKLVVTMSAIRKLAFEISEVNDAAMGAYPRSAREEKLRNQQ